MTLDPSSPPLTRGSVRVVGTGLLGTSVGLALSVRGVDVVLHDPSPTAAALARDMGAGRLPTGDASGEPALVVVAAPPDVTAEVVEAELRRWPTAVVTDVASVKAEPLRAVTAGDVGLLTTGEHRVTGEYRVTGEHRVAGER